MPHQQAPTPTVVAPVPAAAPLRRALEEVPPLQQAGEQSVVMLHSCSHGSVFSPWHRLSMETCAFVRCHHDNRILPCMRSASDSPRMSIILDRPAQSRARLTEGANGKDTTLCVGCVAIQAPLSFVVLHRLMLFVCQQAICQLLAQKLDLFMP